jgi:hypothetical protein
MRTVRVVLLLALALSLSCTRSSPPAAEENPQEKPAAPAAPAPPAAAPDDAPPAQPVDEDPTDRPVLLRLQNATGKPWQEAYVRAGSFRTFGALEPGATSEYQAFRSLHDVSTLAIESEKRWRERRPTDLLGEERLVPAKYTWKVTAQGDQLATESTRDGPLTPEDATAALVKADRRLKAARAQAWLIENRGATLACGEGKGVPDGAMVSLVVAPSGRVGGIVFAGDPLPPPVADCVKKALMGQRFPSYTGAMEPARTYFVPIGKWLRALPPR